MTNDSLIPSFRLDASLVGTRRYFDAWRESVRDFYDVEPLSDRPTGEEEQINAWLLDNLIFTEVAFSPQSFSHHARHTVDANYLSLQIYERGSCRGIIGGNHFELTPGEVHIFDFSREFHSVADASTVAGVVVPHEAIGYDPGRHPAHMSFASGSAAGDYLRSAFFALLGQLPTLRQEEAGALSSAFCGLLQGMLTRQSLGEPSVQNIRSERRAAMLSYLDRHLADPNLGVDHLCNAFNVSRSSIYRNLADVGGVGQYIAQRRLDRCLHQLLSAPASRGRVQEIAARWGFDDPGYFSRLFRRRFGISPSAALGRAGRSLSRQLPVRNGQNLGGWLKAI